MADTLTSSTERLTRELAFEQGERRRAECMARVQSDSVQLALDLLVQEPNVTGFFRVFIKTIVEECESQACGVWLLDDTAQSCELWMARLGDRFVTKESADWSTLALPRESLAAHLMATASGWTQTMEYDGQDQRLPEAVREFNRRDGIDSIVIAPLALPTRNLGWIALPTRNLGWIALSSSGHADLCVSQWRRAILEAIARQATLALHHSRLAEQSHEEERRKAVLEERNRIARDIHDTLAQGFAAILMQLQAAQRSDALSPAIARVIDVAVDLARTHMIEARRSVSALRPQVAEAQDVAAGLRRMADLATRTTDIPVELTIEALPAFGGGVEPEILGIAQEAITNAVRHARARRIAIHASAVRSVGFRLSVADDGRGIARDEQGRGFGMTSMQERADRIGASLTIVTAPRAGTEIVLAWEPPSFSVPGQTDAR